MKGVNKVALNPSQFLSLVIPVYGGEKVLPELLIQIKKAMKLNQRNFEIIFVCDNSPDNSWQVIEKFCENNPNIKGLLLRMNATQHNALMAGFHHAKGEIIVTMDDDLQHSPKDIEILVRAVEEGSDVAYGEFTKRKHPLWQILGSKLNNLVAGFLIGKPKNLYLSPFRAISSNIIKDILRYKGPYVYLDGLILSVTKNITSKKVDHVDRFNGQSHYGFRVRLSLWLKMATSFSIVPLRVTSFLGLTIASLGFMSALLIVIWRLIGNSWPEGWALIVVTILVIGGVQLIALGMLGEYLGRVLITINLTPQYVIEKLIGKEET